LLQYLLPIHSILATIELVALHIITTKHVFFENAPIAKEKPILNPLNPLMEGMQWINTVLQKRKRNLF
jgi:hypothetical protein